MLIKHELHEKLDCSNKLNVEYTANVLCVPERSFTNVKTFIKYIN